MIKKIKEISINILDIILLKLKGFFNRNNLKNHLIGFLVATAFLIVNIIIAYKLGYRTSHNKLYSAGSYVSVLIISYVIYLIRLIITNKKSSSDIIIILYAFLLFWDIAYKSGWVQNDLLIPSPEGLFDVFRTDREYLFEMVLLSLELLFFGFLFAVIFGTVLGLIVGWYKRAREVMIPISNVITLIPPVLITAWLIMWFPFKTAAIAIIFLAVFWPTFQGMISRVSQIDKKTIDAAKVMGVTNFQMLYKVIIPYCLPEIIISISKSLRGAFMCLVAAEMIGINGGIGYYTETYKAYADYRRVLAGIVTIAVLTTVIDIIVHQLKKRIVKWRA